LVGLYVRSGAFGQALQQYQQFESDLKRELGLMPSPATQALVFTTPKPLLNSTSSQAGTRTQYVNAQATAHFELGELALVANNYQAATSAARAGLAIALPAEDTQRMSLVARGHRLLGAALAMEGGDLLAAESHLQEAVAAHKLAENMNELCAALFELGNVAAQRGELKHAVELYKEAAQTAEVARTHYFHALAYNNLAYHSLLLGQTRSRQARARQRF